MILNRRRFLAITASVAATSLAARESRRWQGRAFGSEVSITIRGPEKKVREGIASARSLIAQTEDLFSLYHPESALVQLNRNGMLRPHAHFFQLMELADRAHRLTGGLFDPTVQPLWQSAIHGHDPALVSQLIGWENVEFNATRVALAPGQALTFNGIAQGFATDIVSKKLQALGFTHTLVNIGEYRGTGGPWTLGIEDPSQGFIDTLDIENSAIATSSPMATAVGTHGHIFNPLAGNDESAKPWSTVAVEADNATLADALSTGLVWADISLIKKVRKSPGVRKVTLVDSQGDLLSL